MSKSNPRGNKREKPIPHVPINLWKVLLREADALRALEPWKWMTDDQFLGLRDPNTGEKLLCSVLGALGEVFALLVFRHEAGHRWALNTFFDRDKAPSLTDRNRALDRDLLEIEFENKSGLSDVDRQIMAEAGFSPSAKGSRCWPLFRSIRPGCYPWYLSQTEAETLVYVLPYIRAYAELLRLDPDLNYGVLESGVPFLVREYDVTQRSMKPEDLEWQVMLPPAAPPIESVVFDDITVAQLRQLPKNPSFHLELDVSYSFLACDGPDGPFYPHSAMAVHRGSAQVLGHHLSDHSDPQGKFALGKVLVHALETSGNRPAAIHVQFQRVADALKSVAAELDIPIRIDSELRGLNEIRRMIEMCLPR